MEFSASWARTCGSAAFTASSPTSARTDSQRGFGSDLQNRFEVWALHLSPYLVSGLGGLEVRAPL